MFGLLGCGVVAGDIASGFAGSAPQACLRAFAPIYGSRLLSLRSCFGNSSRVSRLWGDDRGASFRPVAGFRTSVEEVRCSAFALESDAPRAWIQDCSRFATHGSGTLRCHASGAHVGARLLVPIWICRGNDLTFSVTAIRERIETRLASGNSTCRGLAMRLVATIRCFA